MKSTSKAVAQLAELTASRAVAASGSLKAVGIQMVRLAKDLGGRREPHRVRTVLWFAGGAVLVGGVILLFASPGREIRKRIGALFNRDEDTRGLRDAEDTMANEGGGSRPRSEAA